MTPYYADDWLTVWQGDCREVMAQMAPESVHTVVTSPPYWGLRDYGTATWVGGADGCDHVGIGGWSVGSSDKSTLTTGSVNGDWAPGKMIQQVGRGDCRKCGAVRQDSQLGLEPTPEEYVANMVAVFREVRRVLRADGTVWLNLGDSYANDGKWGGSTGGKHVRELHGTVYREPPEREVTQDVVDHLRAGGAAPELVAYAEKHVERGMGRGKRQTGLKPKDLVGIPWRVAFALQADGWYLRSDVIWSKPNPMPESVTDRPTKAHEMVFLLAKGQWKSAVVELSDTGRKRRHLSEDGRFEGQHLWANEVAVGLASAILDSPKLQQDLGLPALHPEVGQEGAYDFYRDLVSRLPIEHRAAVGAARLLAADASPEQFMRELYGLGVTLADRHHLLIGGVPSKVPLPPGVDGYGEGAIAVHHPGQIGKFDFVHGQIITSTPATCTYYYDADAVREDAKPESAERYAAGYKQFGVGQFNGSPTDKRGPKEITGDQLAHLSGRNLRSVWTIATQPYSGAHFATFPEKLVEPCVKAGTSERGVCPECGAPWRRVVEKGELVRDDGSPVKLVDPIKRDTSLSAWSRPGGKVETVVPNSHRETVTTGWMPSCAHSPHIRENAPVPATVLDPFAGSGTTGRVAQRLGRRAVLIDLNADYLVQAMRRNTDIPLGLEES